MRIFDTHIHFNSDKLRSKFTGIVEENKNFFYNIVSTTLTDSIEAIDLSKKYSNTFCSIGIHPLEIGGVDEHQLMEEFRVLLKSNTKILAIGETGLDFFKVEKKTHQKEQTYWLMKQFEIAKEYNLPLILHVRNAYKEIIFLLKNHINWKGIIHCFDGEQDDLIELIRLEKWMISFSPIIYRNIDKFKKIIDLTPLNRIIIESDAPWLTNNNSAIAAIIDLIAEVKRLPKEDIAQTLFKNSLKIFNLN